VTTYSHRGTRVLHDLHDLPGRLIAGFQARAARRRSLAALRRLDDRLLCDVGLSRADVEALSGE
jgi:uncharacterized protein YjiS (DUF1127 family)